MFSRSRNVNIQCLFVFATLLVSGTPAAESGSDAKVKQFKYATKVALQSLDITLEARLKELDLTLDLLDQKVKSGNGAISDSTAVFSALKAIQTGISEAMKVASFALSEAFQDIGVLDDSLPASDLPNGLVFGGGGTPDKYREHVESAVDKALAKAENRARKTGAALEKHASIALLVQLGRPRGFVEGPGPPYFMPFSFAYSVAITLSASRLDEPQTNRVHVFGLHGGADLNLLAYASDHTLTSYSVTTFATTDTWERTLFNVLPGYYVFRLSPNGINGGATSAISVR